MGLIYVSIFKNDKEPIKTKWIRDNGHNINDKCVLAWEKREAKHKAYRVAALAGGGAREVERRAIT
jgi:hypothetical protein